MSHRILLMLGMMGIVVTSNAIASEEAVKLDRQQCSVCHGTGGSTSSELFPQLAGQPAAYFTNQMKAFRDKSRADENAKRFMWGISSRLTDKNIEELAAFYASQLHTSRGKISDQVKYDTGKNIFLNGHPDKGVSACMACHGEKGEGRESIPRLGGQNEAYLKRQLKVFVGTERPAATAMHEIVKGLSDTDIESIAQYLQAQ